MGLVRVTHNCPCKPHTTAANTHTDLCATGAARDFARIRAKIRRNRQADAHTHTFVAIYTRKLSKVPRGAKFPGAHFICAHVPSLEQRAPTELWSYI